MPDLPAVGALDSTLALLREGYPFIANRCRALGSDVFETRLMLQPVICMTGAEAARQFYDTDRFQRAGAAPRRLSKTLFGQGGVQGLDDETHRHRKALFLAILNERSIAELVSRLRTIWGDRLSRWEAAERVVLFDEAEEMLCQAVCAWAGVPLLENDLARRTSDLHQMIDGAGGAGLRHLRARRARARTEAWVGKLIAEVRAGGRRAPEGSALHLVATHRDLTGRVLDEKVAAVELLNVLRPTVAVAWWVAFAGLALHEHPEAVAFARSGAEGRDCFAQEVRRTYPFFPFLAARVRREFEWEGYRFPAGRRVLLDVYGTHGDPRWWTDPERFLPERFRGWTHDPFRFLPQGGGDPATGHRCPGDRLAVEVLKLATEMLADGMRYRVPHQDLRLDLSRIPTLPASRFVIAGVQRGDVRKSTGPAPARPAVPEPA